MRKLLVLLVSLFALATAGVAVAASAPSASTGPVTATGPTSATVSGTVNPNGTATNWYVEYGTSTGYGSKTAAASAGAGTANVPVSTTVSGLRAGTTYHYRVVATSSAGTTHGSDGIFSTSSAPAVTTGAASSIGATSATLNGTVDPNGRNTSWYFEYGTSTSYGTKTPAHGAGSGSASVSVAAPIGGLKTGRKYHFRLVATNDAGTKRGADRSFVASGTPGVTTKTPTILGDSSARLNGSAVPNGSATSAYFEYGTTTSYGARTAAKSLGSGTGAVNVSFTVTGLSSATTYHVRLVATSSSGTRRGTDRSFTTTGRPRASTSAPTAVGGISVTLNGTVNPDGHATSWYAEWGTSTSYGNKTTAKSIGGGQNTLAVSAPLTGLLAGTLYHFRIVATNASGTATSGDTAFTTLGPAVSLSAASTIVQSGHALRLSGTVVTQAAGQSVTIYRQRYGDPSFVVAATVLTGTGGTWGYDARPTIATTYRATTAGGSSAVVAVRVAPTTTLTARSGRFTVRVHAGRSFAGRKVFLQRRTATGRWRIAGTRRLGRTGTTFTPALAKGRWTLRVSIPAAPGYVGVTTRVVIYHKH